MGVDGLLKFLAPIVQRQHLSTFKNQRAAVDIMSWIYKAYYINVQEIRNDSQSIAYLNYINQMLDLLQHYQIDIICVFDGRFVQKKQATIDKRKMQKESNRKRGQQLLEKGEEEQSKKYLNRCINVNQQIISTIIRGLKGRNIPFIVAPYEADSQIAKLFNLSLVDFAICQDSDLIIYGVPVALKLSTEGDCDYLNINLSHLQDIDSHFVRQFVLMSKEKRTQVAILTGTDYLPSIKGIGIKKSLKYLTQCSNIHQAINQIASSSKFKELIPQDYEENVLKAKTIFMLATSYNTLQKKLEFLNPGYLKQIQYEEFCQEKIKEIVGVDYGYDQQISLGLKNPWSFQKRDLTPIIYQSAPKINLASLSQKQMSLSNSKIVKGLSQKENKSSQESNSFQQEIIMICQAKQLKLKAEKVAQMKQSWQNAFTSDVEKMKLKEQEAKERFGDWVKYIPLG